MKHIKTYNENSNKSNTYLTILKDIFKNTEFTISIIDNNTYLQIYSDSDLYIELEIINVKSLKELIKMILKDLEYPLTKDWLKLWDDLQKSMIIQSKYNIIKNTIQNYIKKYPHIIEAESLGLL